MYVRMCLMCRFIVRDFEYEPKAIKAERDAKKRLEDELKKQFVSNIMTTFEYYTLTWGCVCSAVPTLCVV